MFTAQMYATTAMSDVVYQVVGFDGRSIFASRSPEVAVRVAARCNTGDMRVFSTDFGTQD